MSCATFLHHLTYNFGSAPAYGMGVTKGVVGVCTHMCIHLVVADSAERIDAASISIIFRVQSLCGEPHRLTFLCSLISIFH